MIIVARDSLQGLAWVHDEPDLKAMYLHLLAASMDDRRASTAHPGFAEVIKQLTEREARLLPILLNSPTPCLIAAIQIGAAGEKGWTTRRLRRELGKRWRNHVLLILS